LNANHRKSPLSKASKEVNAEDTRCIFRRQYREEVRGKCSVEMFTKEISYDLGAHFVLGE
jgi:hypothetical protein